MRIVPYTDLDEELEDIQTLQINIKSIPFENNYAPSFIIVTPSDDYVIAIDELNCLMDGLEIAKNEIDGLINYLLKFKIKELGYDPFADDSSEDDDE
jgi:hypothetical protein